LSERAESNCWYNASRSLASLGGVTIFSAWPVFLAHASAAPLQNSSSWPTPEQAMLIVAASAAHVLGIMPSHETQAKSMARRERLAGSGMRCLRY
jgi:hypothetical protein